MAPQRPNVIIGRFDGKIALLAVIFWYLEEVFQFVS